MGASKRLSEYWDRASLERMNLRLMVGEPDTLTEWELDLENEPITYDPKPSKARAWVRYGTNRMKVNVYVLAWTARAARVRWVRAELERQETWVWISAVYNEPWVEVR